MIEKNIRLQPHHSRDLLVGRRSDGRRPKYQPPGHRDAPSPSRGGPPGGGGGHHSPPSRPAPAPSKPAPAPSGPPGGGDKQMTYSAPAPSPAPSPHDGGWTRAFESPTNVTGDTPEERLEKEFLETGDYDVFADTTLQPGPKVDIADIHGEWDDPDSVTFAGTDARGNILYDPAAQAAATRKAIAESSPSFFDSGIIPTKLPDPSGIKKFITEPQTGWKKAAKGVLGALSFGMFPGLSSMYYQARGLKKLADRTGLTKNLTKPREPIDQRFQTYVQRKRTSEQRDDGNRDDLAKVVSGKTDVVSKKIAQYTLQDQRKEFENRRSVMQNILDQGTYQGKELTNQQKNELINYIAKIDKYLVETGKMMSAAYGGRVDKALTGRSRDI